ncbi:MAG TPA: hypothetical protein VFN35_23670 [Ktedonobacteraceae bacterium]|nr:hypothetical protein [Ktedonobacteraceae bacterium]
MPRLHKFIQNPVVGKVFLVLLAGVYVVYLVASVPFLHPWASSSAVTIADHQVDANLNLVVQHWTADTMRKATDADTLLNNTSVSLQEENTASNTNASGQQQGQPPSNGNAAYPLSTVGKVFFSNSSGQDFVCSGTAVVSNNKSVVDTAGHCLYWRNEWMKNVIFCPLYESGNTPYGCWAARELEVPSDWLNPPPNDYHHDLGMAIVSANSQGALTDLVGGAGWAYNQSPTQPFYAYGYPAGYPFDGQSRKSCEGAGKSWKHGSGTVVSIPCDMTGGSSGGPWFIKNGNNWYLNGHNDFTSTIQPGHMFSPYYDDTWYTMYNKAQNI